MSTTAELRTKVNLAGIPTAADLAALDDLQRTGMPDAEIIGWASLGPLSIARQLDNANFRLRLAQQFPPQPDLLKHLAASLNRVTSLGMHYEDLIHWHTSGVYLLKPPYVNTALWNRWRSAGIKTLGMRNAAVAAAAGITPEEAAIMLRDGTWNTTTMKLMAALRLARR